MTEEIVKLREDVDRLQGETRTLYKMIKALQVIIDRPGRKLYEE